MRYHYRGQKKPGSRLISLSGIYAFNINPVQQVIVDPKQDNLVVNLDQKLLLVIEDHPDFELVVSKKEKERLAPKPTKPVEEAKATTQESEVLEVKPSPKSEEEPLEEAPKPRKRRGRKPKATKPKVEEKAGDSEEASEKQIEED